MKSLILSVCGLMSMIAGMFALAGIFCMATVLAICIENREGEELG